MLLLALAGPLLAERTLVARVSRVHDGDSLRLERDGRRTELRLVGIDAPESRQPHGPQARAGLKACAAGQVALVAVSGTDRHGRLLGRLEVNGRDCALAQLRAGLAWHYRAYADEQPAEMRRSYSSAERLARQQRRGLWSDPAPTPPWEWRRRTRARQGSPAAR